MQRSRLSVAVTLWLVLAACGKPPSAPSSPGQGGTPSAGATITAVRVTGPARVAPGETATYVAIATYSDRSTRDISATASWTSNPSVLRVSALGAAVGLGPGEATVFAHMPATKGSMPVLVLERGTFKLSGRIVETSDRPLEGVSIDVVSGTGAGRRATANFLGEYALYGVAGLTELRVSGDRFTPQVRDLVVTADTIAENFVLAPREPPAPGIAADWTMTLAPSPTCPVAPPDIARGRSYQMQIKQQGTGLTYFISEPTVTVLNPQFNRGVLFGAHVKLYFPGDTGYGDWSSGHITDHLGPTEMMQFNGTLEGDLKDSTITATLSGDIVYWDFSRTSFAPNWYCRAKDHVVILRK